MLRSICSKIPINKNIIHQAYFLFSKSKQVEMIRAKLIDEGHKLNAPTLIKLTHTLHFKQNSRQTLTPQQQEHVFSKIMPDIFKFNHQDLTLFLQILKQSDAYNTYSRANPVHRQISQRIFSIQTIKMDNNYIYRLLHILLQMKYPQLLINKYIQVILSNAEKIIKEKDPISIIDCLRICITILELPYIPFFIFKEFYTKIMEKEKVSQPVDLCLMHYLLSQMRQSLKNKALYFQQKGKVHEMLFNPFSNLQQKDQNGQKDNSNQEKQQQQQRPIKTNSQKLIEEIQQFLVYVSNKSNINKLEEEIVRIYGYQKFPITPNTATYLANVRGLQETLTQYCEKNYKTFTPLEFIIICKSIMPYSRRAVYEKYCKQMWEYLDMSQKLSLLSLGRTHCEMESINKQRIKEIVNEHKRIKFEELMVLGKFIQQNLNEDDQGEIISLLANMVEKQ